MSDAADALEPDPRSRERSWTLDGTRFSARALEPGLHIVATPIGNLADITLRALAALAAADAILAEDTRMGHRLADHYGIRTRIRRFDAHASEAAAAAIIRDLRAGAALALISDAGTPLLSDPGSALVRQAVEAGIRIHPLPGASALLAALVTAGLPIDRFFFEGFLPPKQGDRRRRLRELARAPGALVFYEAPHRVLEALADIEAILGQRTIAAARELTKLHEAIVRGPAADVRRHFEEQAPRGEFVLVVAPPDGADDAADRDPDERLRSLIGAMSVKDAAAVVASELGLPRRDVYARALLLQASGGPQPKERRQRDDDEPQR
ncbi:MAG: 16S rRNA (cytidine(1402)-2'-O)-methyltransferase [Methylocystis sp.]|nr:16S rRNA (cytidine(1402)-2'-O)-methyltransferase [Methylocystis sp.]MCA3584909.1 16S rRNA (cytidine(1402)-2'-O)-methyltransferase [Methylocystis sp.]MCA3589696.1 16S rRNA (cytidine(1402)-2'-O)-methyltransferase [Methylocystis sp.]MCA3591127.1 16S rRNA (cytidine(1402)-2'-O)-methyltransferase [Methylocystis sp.]